MAGSVVRHGERGWDHTVAAGDRQLERMLCDPLFLARPKQALIFEYLVQQALDGAKIYEDTLFTKFFSDKRYAESTTGVRTNVSLIRTQLLKAYYDGNGKYDPVVISLPAPERSNKRKKTINSSAGRRGTPTRRRSPSIRRAGSRRS